MYYSAKRGIDNACRPSVRPSVCPSVTLLGQDHISWKSWKLITWTISPTSSLFVAQRPSGVLEHKSAISLKRVKIVEKLPWRAYRKSPTLFRTYYHRPSAASPSPRLGFATPTQKLQSRLSQKRVKLRTANVADT